MHPFDQLISTFSEDNKARGTEFEVLCKWILETDPVYANTLTDVWMWSDWPERWDDQDLGIDLIAKDAEGKIWAIQAKCYKPENSINKGDINSFIAYSSHPKIDVRLLIATTDKVASTAVRTMQLSHELKPVQQLLLTELRAKPWDWPKSLDELSSGGIAKKYTPKPHQQAAISDVVTGFKKYDRGQMIMACGTGKTLAGLWIAETLKAETTLVLFPSLLLLSGTLKDWLTHSKEPFSFLPVCSDGTVTKKADDSISFKTSDLSFPSTTDETEIAEFLKRDGKKVIFSTYQSCRQIAAAYKIADLRPLDLVIADEAHRCAGKAGADYTTALDNKEIPAVKRLFMTATPKIFQTHIKKAAEESGVEVLSMDDADLFGPVVHKLSFGAAIANDPPLLTDYQVVVVGVDDSLCAEMISERQLIKTENEIETDAQSFASHIGLAKAIKSYDLRRVITFHSKVKSANDFQNDFSGVVDWMPEESRPDGDFITNYVSGAMSTGQRNKNLTRLGELEEGERAILSNSRCLSEGVDVPALDGVAFIDPRNSEIDIIQAVGRAIRLSSGKTVGTIVIPVFIAEHEDPDEVLNDSVFKKVWAVVNALRSHDEGLGIELDILRQQLGKRGSVGKAGKIHFDLPTTISVEFEKALSVKLIESTTASWEFWFGLLETYKEEHGNCIPEHLYKVDGKALGTWVSAQRALYKRVELTPERVNTLEEIGFVWDIDEYNWERAFEALILFKNKFRDCHVSATPPYKCPTSGIELGYWVSNQRTQYKNNNLDTERIRRLEAIGFTWDMKAEIFEQGFTVLVAYKKDKGNLDVPARFKTENGFPLGKWVSHRRNDFKKDKLDSERIRQLEDIGFIWDPHAAKWEEGFTHLTVYSNVFNHTNVPIRFKTEGGYPLGKWMSVQRYDYKNGTLVTERIQRLDELGFVLKVKN